MTDFPPYSARSAAQIFEEDGLLFYPQLFEGQELARLRDACEGILQNFLADVDRDESANKNLTVMRHLNDPRWYSDNPEAGRLLLETVADPRCLGPVEQIFRGESLFRSTSLFFPPRHRSFEGNWHRDLQFILQDEGQVKAQIGSAQVDGLQLQIALVDNDDVEYVPFSARRYDSPEEYYFRCADDRKHSQESGMPNAVRIQQRAGDALIFNANGLHRGRYHTDRPRRTLMLTYTSSSRPFCDGFSRQPWMAEEGSLSGLSGRATAYFRSFIAAYQEFWQKAEN